MRLYFGTKPTWEKSGHFHRASLDLQKLGKHQQEQSIMDLQEDSQGK
jgi:hypothetical protein